MHVYNVLLSDNSCREIYADSAEIAERDIERELIADGKGDVFVVIAEEV